MSLKNLLARCSVALVNASAKMQTAQVRLLAGEVKDNIEHFEPYGFTSNAHAGAEGIAAFFAGDRSHGVVLCIADRRFRLKELKPGEVALYTDEGDCLHFKRGRVLEIQTMTLRVTAGTAVEFDTPVIRTTGKIESDGDQIAAGVSQINHPHKDTMPAAGYQSGPPLPQGG